MRSILTATFLFGLSFACGPSGELDGAETGSGLRVRLTGSSPGAKPSTHDAPGRDAITSAFIRVDRVTAHGSDGWVAVREGIAVDVDVLRLAEHTVDLGFLDLPPGRISQVRLHVNEETEPYVVYPDASTALLKVPSGEQSGLKIKGKWELGECEQLVLDMEFDGPKSIHIHDTGSRGIWVLRPVVKAGDATTVPIEDCQPDGPGDQDGDEGDDGDDGDDGDVPEGDDPNDLPNEGSGNGCAGDVQCSIGSYCNEAGICSQL